MGDVQTDSAEESCQIGCAGAARLRILLAYDDDRVLRAVARLLSADGHQVHTVADGLRLLHELSAPSPPFALVVAQHRLRGVLGLSLLSGLRGGCLRVDDRTPFILIAPAADVAARTEALARGAATLDDPFDPQVLRRWVRRTATLRTVAAGQPLSA